MSNAVALYEFVWKSATKHTNSTNLHNLLFPKYAVMVHYFTQITKIGDGIVLNTKRTFSMSLEFYRTIEK